MGDLDPTALALQAATYLGLILLCGAAVFAQISDSWIVRPGAVLGALLLCGASVGAVGYTAWQMEGTLPDFLVHTHPGMAALWRSVSVPLAGLLFTRRLRILVIPLIACLLWTFTRTSHAGASHEWLPQTMDMLHLIGVVTWPGLLFYYTLSPDAKALPAVSTLSLSSVVLLGATGVYAACRNLSSLSMLRETEYGQALLLKTGIIAAILLVAAVNRFRLMPRLPDPAAVRQLRGTIAVEAFLMLGVLAAAAILTSRDLPS